MMARSRIMFCARRRRAELKRRETDDWFRKRLMKVFKTLTLLIVLLALGCASSRLPRPGDVRMRNFQFPLRDFRLPSGMRIVIEEDRSNDRVVLVSVVGSGSAQDPMGKEGLAHLVEHLTFRARPNGRDRVWNLLE